MTLGEEIARLRRTAGITLTDLAVRTGLSKQALMDIELDRERPPEFVLKRIAEHIEHVGGTHEYLMRIAEGRPYKPDALWELRVANGPIVRGVSKSQLLDGIRSGWAQLDDEIRQADGPWRTIRDSLGRSEFDFQVYVDPSAA